MYTNLPSVLRFDKPPAEAALFFPEHSFNSRSDDLLVKMPIGVVLLNIITLLVDVALKITVGLNKIYDIFNGQ